MELEKALYLLPVNLSEAPLEAVIPEYNFLIIKELRHFIVENVRSARRFIKRCDPSFPIGEAEFFELNRHTDPLDIPSFLAPLRQGFPMGLMSEAGCPGVADPGALAVTEARKQGFRIVPLVGPSSILLSLMGSGFNGQNFAFHGYLPIDASERDKKIKMLETQSAKTDTTQIFIETPYRNNKLLQSLVKNLRGDTRICVACNVTDPESESIIVKKASQWQPKDFIYDKKPTIFLISAG